MFSIDVITVDDLFPHIDIDNVRVWLSIIGATIEVRIGGVNPFENLKIIQKVEVDGNIINAVGANTSRYYYEELDKEPFYGMMAIEFDNMTTSL